MALKEGFRRVRFVGNGILVTGLVLEASALIAVVAGIAAHSELVAGFAFFATMGVPICIAGATLLLAAWIVEGFLLAPRRPPSSDESHSPPLN
jgi:hypothetical protein